MAKFTFDLTLLAAITVEASSEAEARKMVHASMDGMDCNGGAWPDGSPILFEASIEGEIDLASIDGEFLPGM